jgi:hypothetical protein
MTDPINNEVWAIQLDALKKFWRDRAKPKGWKPAPTNEFYFTDDGGLTIVMYSPNGKRHWFQVTITGEIVPKCTAMNCT